MQNIVAPSSVKPRMEEILVLSLDPVRFLSKPAKSLVPDANDSALRSARDGDWQHAMHYGVERVHRSMFGVTP
jgi:hypothetical protein